MKTDSPGKGDRRKTRVLIVDDHPIVREGLIRLFSREADLAVCAEAGNMVEAMEAAGTHKPDVAVVDISLKGGDDGLALTELLHARHPRIRILILSIHDEALYARTALRAGARGYIMKEEAPRTVVAAIREVMAGRIHVSDGIAQGILGSYAGSPRKEDDAVVARLSVRERQVLRLVARGHSAREIGSKLCLSPKTVETHCARARQKTGARNARELVQWALQWLDREDPS